MANDSGLSKEELDELLEGSGLEDFDASYLDDEEDNNSQAGSGNSSQQVVTKTRKSQIAYTEIDNMTPEQLLKLPNLKIISDIKVTLSVEIGRTKMEIKDVLSLGDGSIVELDKFSDDLVDILVNGMIIAKGQVVSIGDSFGVKVVNIIDEEERYRHMSK